MVTNKFQGVIVNASFPRSGHRFLRELCLGYFSHEMRFLDSYSMTATADGGKSKRRTPPANYIKTHDFELQGLDVLKAEFPLRRKYIVQVRHPLEAIASYYEFARKTNEVKKDTKSDWLTFLDKKLVYWKRFCETWLAQESASVLLVTYESLYHLTELELKKVVQFITGDQSVDNERLSLIVSKNKKAFNQYAAEDDSAKVEKRDISKFSYFDEDRFQSIEDELFHSYLHPLGIVRLLHW